MTDEDRKLMEWIALEVMEWFHPTLSDGTYVHSLWVNRQEIDLSIDPQDTIIMPVASWLPLTNANHWMMVVEKMREKGWLSQLTDLGVAWEAKYIPDSGHWEDFDGLEVSRRDISLGRAILLAAKVALEAEHG